MQINGFDGFYENDGDRKSPIYQWAPENSAAIRTLYVAREGLTRQDLTDAALALLGCAVLNSENGPGGTTRRWIERRMPALHPGTRTDDNPAGDAFMPCTSITSATPCGRPSGIDDDLVTNYDWYRYETRFEAVPYNVLPDSQVFALEGPLADTIVDAVLYVEKPDEGDALRRGWVNSRWIVRTLDPGSRTITTRSIAQWCEYLGLPAAGLNEGIGLPQSRATVRYHWLAVPYEAVNQSLINKSYGCVNDDVFDGFPTGTLLLLDPTYRKYRSAFGQRVMDVSFQCVYQPNYNPGDGSYGGLNSSLRVIAGRKVYWPISANGKVPSVAAPAVADGRNLFPFISFPALFRPSQE